MKIQFHFISSALLLAGLSLFTSCETEEVNRTSGSVAVQATVSPLTAMESQQGRIVINDFRINMKEVEFEFDKTDLRSTTEVAIKDVKLKGPFEFDLLSPSGSLSALAATVELPNAVYEEVGFKTHKGTSGVMLDRAVLMTGTIDGVPFEFWHDMDEEFDVDFTDANQDLVVNGQDQALIIDYKLGTLVGAASGVDLTTATDGNGDGRIEIHSKDTDGNQNLAKALRDSLRNAIKLIDDK
ncbi:hypothetical protein ABID22_002208 [Pontibacter aydingkolensis]|uniref:DUF4382 domain-containing protein n=1 Tax=Pontibacter aydingkolensis TaxID=1911536 RepID=A0ABS7CVG5_9BACT|nr:hypothetical protein [Pontibacter aydingkolensis]MBW7467814.1 hypothetical protein [Pontibacter aydingkolensis]